MTFKGISIQDSFCRSKPSSNRSASSKLRTYVLLYTLPRQSSHRFLALFDYGLISFHQIFNSDKGMYYVGIFFSDSLLRIVRQSSGSGSGIRMMKMIKSITHKRKNLNLKMKMKTRTSLLIQSFLPFHYTMFEINKKSHLNFCAKIAITCTYLFDTKSVFQTQICTLFYPKFIYVG